MRRKNSSDQPLTLQEQIETLETLIETLENPNLDLNEAVDLYATAIKTAAPILKTLNDTEKKLTLLQTEAETLLNTTHD